ncbi:MAG: tetratricopeptide repeat protein [Cyclobacterium sp.]|uniref:tetratricopeptide repeat protein n=1 Tax=unclassified Cyclobacterium TaxID=2615055 RepID=UPI0013D75DA4|nr:tetratricopeptide repeat protein [Cyclobacterium sp. SYSU L10401]
MVETIEKGIICYKEGKFEEALLIFDKLVQSDGPKSEYLHFRGRIQSRLGSLDQAISDFDKLIALEPFNTTFISDRAVVLHLLKRNQEAMEAFDQALNLDPNNPYRYSSRAYFKDRIGDLKGAIADYEKAIALDPEDAIAYNNKGLVEEKLGYQQKSKNSFSEADRLSGYDNKESKEDFTSPENTSLNEPHFIQEDENKPMSLGHYFSILTDLFTKKETRHEFKQFLSSKFKGS